MEQFIQIKELKKKIYPFKIKGIKGVFFLGKRYALTI